MSWEDLLREWRRRSDGGRTAAIGAAGHAAVLAAPRRRRRPWLLLVLVALLGAMALLWLGPGRGSTAAGDAGGAAALQLG